MLLHLELHLPTQRPPHEIFLYIVGCWWSGKSSEACDITSFLYPHFKKSILIMPKSHPKLYWLMCLGLWKLLSTTIQALALIVVLQPISYSHDNSPILLQCNIASLRWASWLKMLEFYQTILANQLLSLLWSVLITTARATVA